MKKREKMPKIMVTKHGNTYIPPINELPKPLYINCPECGETWTGYKEQMDGEFLANWKAELTTKHRKILGITVEDTYNRYICPECGCEFEVLDRNLRSYDVSEKLFEGVCVVMAGSLALAIIVSSANLLASDGPMCKWTIALILWGAFLASLMVLVWLNWLDTCGLHD
ncbi:MAG: hypothetical protein IKU36_02295 [Bacteroidales bacterium]|nr:hypothetical protein [Bacteroidales bacterium]